jgi:pyruvate,water dikinase
MLVEASWGLGESVVSGRVMPDRFHVDRSTGHVQERHISRKATMLTPDGQCAVEATKQHQACLSDGQLAELAELGRRVETLYGDPRDIEWAWAEGRLWLLQARPITVAGAAEREQVRREEIAALQAKAAPHGTVWSRFNLAEILPAPTPMTWAIVRRFMSGRGGFGLMYRDLGFDPDPALDEEGIYDLICGRPYCNLSREPRMQYRRLPFEHPFDRLKTEPARAFYPQPTLNPARGGWRFWFTLPWITWRLMRSAAVMRAQSRTFPRHFREQILPAYLRELSREEAADLTRKTPPQLVDDLEHLIRLTLYDFARESLKPTVFAALAMGGLERGLGRTLGGERARAAIGELITGVRLDAEADLPGAVRALAGGTLSREEFLQRFGHRGNQEMELAQPRWSEQPPGEPGTLAPEGLRTASPEPDAAGAPEQVWERIAGEAKLSTLLKDALHDDLSSLQTYMALRETAKHYLMKGYAQIRRTLVELDQRYALRGGIFFLTPDELPRLIAGEDLSALIRQRRQRRSLGLSLEVPPVIFSDELDALGRPMTVAGSELLQGVPLSAGIAEAPALVLHEPNGAAVPDKPYILVCSSTDPAWVPLFVRARGLLMETGGVLSHGAIVAREFGLPAVAGLPDITRRLMTGQRLRIDGGTGRVTVLS